MTLEEIAKLVKINDTDENKARSIADSIKEGSFEAPALLIWDEMNQAVTGSHRIEAARILMEADEEKWFDYEMATVDVSDIMAECESPEYDNLRSIFEGTEFADVASENDEW